MAKTLEVTVTGVDQLIANVKNLANKSSDAALRALREESEVIMTEAKNLTPVDTGALRGSGRVTATKEPGGALSAQLMFGNASVDYALIVHENTTAHHDVGQSKYLEEPLNRSLPNLPDRISKRIGQILKGLI
jgi:hypothetical protein